MSSFETMSNEELKKELLEKYEFPSYVTIQFNDENQFRFLIDMDNEEYKKNAEQIVKTVASGGMLSLCVKKVE